MRGKIHYFWFGFVAGVTPILVGLIETPVAGLHEISEILGTPGVIVSLPVINLVQSPFWAVGCIATLNGVVYGLMAVLIGKLKSAGNP